MSKLRIYLAARYSWKDKLKLYRDQIVELGHEVTSRWIDTDYSNEDRYEAEGPSSAPPHLRLQTALMDVEDIARANVVVSFNCESKGRGGRHVEFGLAVAMHKTVVLIGEPEHVFHYLPQVRRYDTWEDFWRVIQFDANALLPTSRTKENE